MRAATTPAARPSAGAPTVSVYDTTLRDGAQQQSVSNLTDRKSVV